MRATNGASVPFWHRHVHTAEVVAEHYTPAPHDVRLKNTEMWLIERAMYGVTTVTQRCQTCGEQWAYTATGDARTTSTNADERAS